MKELSYQAPRNELVKKVFDKLLSNGGKFVEDRRVSKDLKRSVTGRQLTVRFEHLIIRFMDSDQPSVEIDDMKQNTLLGMSRVLLQQPKVFISLVVEYNALVERFIKEARASQQQRMQNMKPIRPEA